MSKQNNLVVILVVLFAVVGVYFYLGGDFSLGQVQGFGNQESQGQKVTLTMCHSVDECQQVFRDNGNSEKDISQYHISCDKQGFCTATVGIARVVSENG